MPPAEQRQPPQQQIYYHADEADVQARYGQQVGRAGGGVILSYRGCYLAALTYRHSLCHTLRIIR